MGQIKGKNTKQEMLARKFLHAYGFRYKLHDKLSRQTWYYFTQYKAIAFVHPKFASWQELNQRFIFGL